jgi:hypothetical protein
MEYQISYRQSPRVASVFLTRRRNRRKRGGLIPGSLAGVVCTAGPARGMKLVKCSTTSKTPGFPGESICEIMGM